MKFRCKNIQSLSMFGLDFFSYVACGFKFSFVNGIRRLIIIFQCDWLLQVEGMQVHANEGGVTQTRGGIYWIILPAGCKALTHPLSLPYTSLGNNTNKKSESSGFFSSVCGCQTVLC